MEQQGDLASPKTKTKISYMGKALVTKPASLRSIGEKKEELEVVLEMA